MEKFIKNWRDSTRSDEGGDKSVSRSEDFVSVEVVRASLSKIVAERLLADVAHKKWSPRLLAYCKIYYEAPPASGGSGSTGPGGAAQSAQILTACTKKVEGIDLDFQWQWNFRTRITIRKNSRPRLELHLCSHESVDIPTRSVDIDLNKSLKDKSEGEVQLMMENSHDGANSTSTGSSGREGTISLYLSKGGKAASDTFTDVQEEYRCGVLRVVVYQAKALHSKYSSYVAISLPHEPKKREHRTNECATPKAPVWDSTVEFDVVNLNGDLRLDVWESHTIRSDAPIGQVIIPLAWLVDGTPLVSYFEIFPVNSESDINRGGQYMKGAELPTRGEKSLGYLRVSAQLKLQNSPRALYLNNSTWLFKSAEVNKARTAQPASLILLKHNMERMHRKYRSIFFVEVVKDILNWKRGNSLSAVGLALHCYLCLLAPVWHVPIALCFAIYAIGQECAKSRDFHYLIDNSDYDDDDIPAPVKTPSGDRKSTGSTHEKADSEGRVSTKSEKSKTIQDRIRETRTTATRLQRKMGKGITMMEKTLNLLMMADPDLSWIFYQTLFGFSVFASFVLYWVPIRIVFLLAGFLAFVPKERYMQAMTWARERSPKRPVQQQARRGSETIQAGSKPSAPATGSPAVEKRHGHVCSGFLFAVEWAGEPIGDDLPDDDIDDPWTRRWCTLWSTPPTLQASTRDDELNIPLPGLAIAEYKELDFGSFDVRKNKKGGKDKNAPGMDMHMFETLHAFGIHTAPDSVSTRDSFFDGPGASEAAGNTDDTGDGRTQGTTNKRRASNTFTRDFRVLHTFRLVDRAGDRCWIFGAANRDEMESWMQSLIGCGAVHLTPLELSLAPTYNKPYIYRLVKSLFELVPDDVDLEHRYICSLARRSAQQIEERAPTRRFMPDDGSGKGAMSSGETGRMAGTQIRVSLLTAKGLPFKEQSFKFVGPLGNAIAKIYAILFLVPSSVSRDRYRSMSQARSSEPVWREDFRFTNVSLAAGTELQVVLVSKDPLSFGKRDDESSAAFLRNHKHLAELVESLPDNETFIGFARVPVSDQYGQQAWYPVEPVYSQNNQAAVLLELSVV